MDQEGQINQWLLDDSDEDLNISLDEDDSEDSDAEQPANSEHDSNSEVSGDDIGQDQPESSGPHYIGRDNVTLWNVHPPPASRRRRQRNIVIHPPGVKRTAQHAKTVYESWCLFFPDNVLEDIVRYTNDRLRKLRTNYTRESDVVDSNIDEIKALIDLRMKIHQHLHLPQNELAALPQVGQGRVKCGYCPKKKNRKTASRCASCQFPICGIVADKIISKLGGHPDRLWGFTGTSTGPSGTYAGGKRSLYGMFLHLQGPQKYLNLNTLIFGNQFYCDPGDLDTGLDISYMMGNQVVTDTPVRTHRADSRSTNNEHPHPDTLALTRTRWFSSEHVALPRTLWSSPVHPFYEVRTASLAQQSLLATPTVSTHAQSRLLDV
uniref:PiggyBac transposable element-derived protein domain-containing protein n=1 Tax=Timema bartmani TaxID=61472 RepID=A0A7R9F823_9NEOP|nr:unnamed protein product [Timema bartmani]